MNGANFRGTNLRGVDMSYAHAMSAFFAEADLSGAILKASCVIASDFTNAKLVGADLELTDFRCGAAPALIFNRP